MIFRLDWNHWSQRDVSASQLSEMPMKAGTDGLWSFAFEVPVREIEGNLMSPAIHQKAPGKETLKTNELETCKNSSFSEAFKEWTAQPLWLTTEKLLLKHFNNQFESLPFVNEIVSLFFGQGSSRQCLRLCIPALVAHSWCGS